MNKINILSQIFSQHRIIPVIKINDIEKAVAVVHALNEGGINIVEITLFEICTSLYTFISWLVFYFLLEIKTSGLYLWCGDLTSLIKM